MVTNDEEHLREALLLVTSVRGSGSLECPWCGLTGLSALELWTHQPLYHIYEPDILDTSCPACGKHTSRLTRHISLHHGPTPRVDERTGVFALAIIRRPTDGKFLLVQERYGEGYWVAGGGVDCGESLRQGVVREALEEAGADIEVTGILTVESHHRGAWRRIIFLAEPRVAVGHLTDGAVAAAAAEEDAAAAPGQDAAAAGLLDQVPPPHPTTGPQLQPQPRYRCKTLPDVESAGACWVAADQLSRLPLRNASEPMTWIPWVAGGGAVMPLDPAGCPDLVRVFPDVSL